MTQRVLFVEPRGVRANVFARYINLPLMGPIYLASELKQAGMDVALYNENILGRELTLSELDGDVLCLSALTSTVERAYTIARQFKARNPHSRVIMGGIHASFLPEEAAQFVDHVVAGEGEGILPDLIRYGSGEKIIRTTRLENLDQSAFPDFSLVKNNHRMRITPVMTSRGCPFACTFCSVTAMFGRRYRTVSIDRVMEELDQVQTRKIFFYDDNFVVNKKRTHALLDRMLAMKKRFSWTAQLRTDATLDPDLIEKMAAAGCSWVYIGFESINIDTLKGMKKSQNVADIERAISVFHRNRISIHGMFIFGSDEDDRGIFRRTVDFCRQTQIDSVQYLILTPLPGTVKFAELEREDRLIHRMWEYYDTMHVVFTPQKMTASELQKGMFDAFGNFYSLTRLFNESFNIVLKIVLALPDLLTRLFRSRQVGRRIHLLLYIFARRIVVQWGHFNRDYFHYLIDISSSNQDSDLHEPGALQGR